MNIDNINHLSIFLSVAPNIVGRGFDDDDDLFQLYLGPVFYSLFT